MSKVDRILRIVEERDALKNQVSALLERSRDQSELVDEIFEFYASKVEGCTADTQRAAFYTSRMAKIATDACNQPMWDYQRLVKHSSNPPEKFVHGQELELAEEE